MTDKQAKTIEALRKDILKHDSHNDINGEYEYKRFEIHEDDSNVVFLYTSVGRIIKEATPEPMLLTETQRHILIGEKGGCTLLNPAKVTKDEITHYKNHTVKKGYWACVYTITI